MSGKLKDLLIPSDYQAPAEVHLLYAMARSELTTYLPEYLLGFKGLLKNR